MCLLFQAGLDVFFSPDVVGLHPPEGRASSPSPGVSCGSVWVIGCTCAFGWVAACLVVCFLGICWVAVVRELLVAGCSWLILFRLGALIVSGLPSLLEGFWAQLLQRM